MKWLSIAAWFGFSSCNEKPGQSAVSGPFEIICNSRQESSGSWFNNGTSPFEKTTISYFQVRHQGRPVSVPGEEGPSEIFWDALFLQDAPRPAVLAGLHSMYLITAEKGQPRVEMLDEQRNDFAGYQWLDSEGGQPGPSVWIGLSDKSGLPRFLTGGRYLLVNGRTVLDVPALKAYPFDKDSWEALQRLGDYYSRNDAVRMVSPDRTQLVFVGGRSRESNRMLYDYALVVVDFIKNQAYAVPFDQTDTRFETVWDVTPAWINTYFEWIRTGKTERLALKKLASLPYWQGRLHEDTYAGQPGRMDEFHLRPVRPTMLPKFLDFIKQEFNAGEITSSSIDSNTYFEIKFEDAGLKLSSYPEKKEIALYIPSDVKTEASFALLRRIGERFNAELGKGRFQEDFDRFD